jgi:hypothetical protein
MALVEAAAVAAAAAVRQAALFSPFFSVPLQISYVEYYIFTLSYTVLYFFPTWAWFHHSKSNVL